ncbi:hypothetical protein L1887_51313 [Cichorium endivia]|nr:hypothetical protein L1887_51313 [Cichorium endivia]
MPMKRSDANDRRFLQLVSWMTTRREERRQAWMLGHLARERWRRDVAGEARARGVGEVAEPNEVVMEADGLLHLCARGLVSADDAGGAGVLFVASRLALATLQTAEVLDAAVGVAQRGSRSPRWPRCWPRTAWTTRQGAGERCLAARWLRWWVAVGSRGLHRESAWAWSGLEVLEQCLRSRGMRRHCTEGMRRRTAGSCRGVGKPVREMKTSQAYIHGQDARTLHSMHAAATRFGNLSARADTELGWMPTMAVDGQCGAGKSMFATKDGTE